MLNQNTGEKPHTESECEASQGYISDELFAKDETPEQGEEITNNPPNQKLYLAT